MELKSVVNEICSALRFTTKLWTLLLSRNKSVYDVKSVPCIRCVCLGVQFVCVVSVPPCRWHWFSSEGLIVPLLYQYHLLSLHSDLLLVLLTADAFVEHLSSSSSIAAFLVTLCECRKMMEISNFSEVWINIIRLRKWLSSEILRLVVWQ